MTEEVDSLIKESINLELNIGDIYLLFCRLFPSDVDLWGRLTLEEKDHASILQAGTEYLKLAGIFPTKLFHANLQTLKDMNRKLLSLIEQFKENPPSREDALNMALTLEHSAGELEFQQFMDEEANSKTYKVFKELNKYNKEHAALIRSYMDDHGISVTIHHYCKIP